MIQKLKEISFITYFLFFVFCCYIIILIVSNSLFFESLKFFYKVLVQIVPLLVVIFILMGLSNYFIKPDFIKKHMVGKGIKKWIYVIIGGILSSGPLYIWYPLLADLKKKGLNHGLIACFLYNRAIKIPLIPVAIFYFSMEYVLILCLVMVVISVIQGILLNSLMEG